MLGCCEFVMEINKASRKVASCFTISAMVVLRDLRWARTWLIPLPAMSLSLATFICSLLMFLAVNFSWLKVAGLALNFTVWGTWGACKSGCFFETNVPRGTWLGKSLFVALPELLARESFLTWTCCWLIEADLWNLPGSGAERAATWAPLLEPARDLPPDSDCCRVKVRGLSWAESRAVALSLAWPTLARDWRSSFVLLGSSPATIFDATQPITGCLLLAAKSISFCTKASLACFASELFVGRFLVFDGPLLVSKSVGLKTSLRILVSLISCWVRI